MRGALRARVAAGPTIAPAVPPADFDDFVEWLERVGAGLVLLDDRPLTELGPMLATVAPRVRAHVDAAEPAILERAGREPSESEATMLVADHRWFEISLEQLDWFYRIIERDDHGGHRQALGQYVRLLAESLRRHRWRERAWYAGGPVAHRAAIAPSARKP